MWLFFKYYMFGFWMLGIKNSYEVEFVVIEKINVE